MTQNYLDSVCEEINEELQQNMQISLSEITHKYNFPIDFVRRLLQERLGTIIQGMFNSSNEKIMTSSFLEIMRSKLKGCLRATTKQISIALMAKEYNIEESNIFMIVEELIKEESIDG